MLCYIFNLYITLNPEEPEKVYKRHIFTDTGVSPLLMPGFLEALVVTDSDEHDKEGHIVEDAEIRIKMVQKRLFKKLPLIQDDLMGKQRIAMLHFSELWPFPLREKFDYLSILKKADLTICIEHNAIGQFERILKTKTSFKVTQRINRCDSRAFTMDELIAEINRVMK